MPRITDAAAPRTAAPVPSGERTRCTGDQAELATRCSSSASSGSRSQGSSRAYVPPSTTAGTSTRLTTVDSPMPSQRAASVTAADASASPVSSRTIRSSTEAAPDWRRISSWPARRSRQPFAPHEHRGPCGSTGRCPISPAQPAHAFEQRAGRAPARRRCRSRRRRARSPAGPNRAEFGERGEVRLVAPPKRSAAELRGQVDVVPAEVGGQPHAPGGRLDQSRHRDARPRPPARPAPRPP